MNIQKTMLLLIFFSFKQLVFSQSKKLSKEESIIQLDLKNNKLHEMGKNMELKFNNSEIKLDKDIKTKSFVIERSPNIKINITPDSLKF